jgi:nucleotide-binding universal stress UspA family protein
MNGGQPDPIRRIVVGVDGSDDAMRAVVWSARLARATGAEVIAAHTIESPVFLEGFPLVTGTIPAASWDVAWKEWREHTHASCSNSGGAGRWPLRVSGTGRS